MFCSKIDFGLTTAWRSFLKDEQEMWEGGWLPCLSPLVSFCFATSTFFIGGEVVKRSLKVHHSGTKTTVPDEQMAKTCKNHKQNLRNMHLDNPFFIFQIVKIKYDKTVTEPAGIKTQKMQITHPCSSVDRTQPVAPALRKPWHLGRSESLDGHLLVQVGIETQYVRQ